MCCLFGLVDYGDKLSIRNKEKIIRVLSIESEARGTDATGVAYMTGNKMTIFKKPLPARKVKFKFNSKDCFSYHAKESVLSIDVYEYFNSFCEVNNYDCSISQAKLTIELKKLTYPDFVKFTQIRKGEKTGKGIKGVKLLDLC